MHPSARLNVEVCILLLNHLAVNSDANYRLIEDVRDLRTLIVDYRPESGNKLTYMKLTKYLLEALEMPEEIRELFKDFLERMMTFQAQQERYSELYEEEVQ